FRLALDADPYYRSARKMLAVSLLMTGQLEEAEKETIAAGAMYPLDPSFNLMRGVILALRGKKAEARAVLKKIGEGMDDQAVKLLAEDGVEILAILHEWDGDLSRNDAQVADLGKRWAKLSPLASKFFPGAAEIRDEKDVHAAANALRAPPALADGFVAL